MKANPKYLKAHALVEYAVRTGKLKPQPCKVCGKAKTQAHHKDYKKPLSVEWLCSFHHHEKHKKTHCSHGHKFTKENTYVDKNGWRECRTCHRYYERGRQRLLPKTGPTTPQKNLAKTHCPIGHKLYGSNVYIDPRGWRQCKTCRTNRWGKGV